MNVVNGAEFPAQLSSDVREPEIRTFDDVVASSPVRSQEPLGYLRSKEMYFYEIVYLQLPQNRFTLIFFSVWWPLSQHALFRR